MSPEVQRVVHNLETFYHNHPGYKHYFWDYIAKGEFDLPWIQRYALYYYEHVRFFRLYLAGAMTIIPVEGLQVALAQTIADEFGVRLWEEPDVDGHPELFRRFMRSLNLTEDDYGLLPKKENTLEGIAHYRKVHYGMFRSDLVEEMVGAIIFGMERTTPHRHSSVLQGLEIFEARTGIKADSQFYSEHVGVDEYHNTALIDPIADWFLDPIKVARMKKGTIRSFDARQEFLDDLASTLGVPKPAAETLDSAAIPATVEWRDTRSVLPHEQCDDARLESLREHFLALPEKTMQAITVTKSGVILDGHHRWNVSMSLGVEKIPCVVVDYDDVVLRGERSKDDVLKAALNGIMLSPKSTFHYVQDINGETRPIITLSPTYEIIVGGCDLGLTGDCLDTMRLVN